MDKTSLWLTFFASAVMFGFGYSQDILQALQGPFRQQPYNFTASQFNLLYFFTFLPIAVLDIPIGMIVDKYPIKISMYTLLLISLIAQVTIALSLQFMVSHYLWIMYGMRSAFGIAGEGMFTVQGIIVAKYAKSNYQIIMGVALSLPFLMDAINSAVTTAVYDATGYMALTWYIGAILCFISLICGILLHRKFMAKDDEDAQTLKQNQILQQQAQKKSQPQGAISQQVQVQQDHFSIKSLKSLSKQFWILTGAIFFAQASLGPFNDNLNDLIVKRFNIPYATVGKLLLIPFTFLAPFSLAVGTICTKRPHYRRNIMLISSIIYFLAISSVYLLPNTKQPSFLYYLILVVFLFAESCQFSIYYAGMVTSVPYVVPKKMVGTAFGASGSAMALAQCLTPLGYMAVMESSPSLIKQYENLNLFGIGVALMTILFSLWMKRDNFKSLDFKLQDQKHLQETDSHDNQNLKFNEQDQKQKDQFDVSGQQSMRQSLISNEQSDSFS